MPEHVFTVGHSRHDWETFADLVSPFRPFLLVDVRSNPVSRFAPWANRKRLPDLLVGVGAQYEWLGDRLGGKPKDRSLYDAQGRPDLGAIAATPTFKDGVKSLVNLARDRVVVLMCGEEDPVACHRRLAVGPGLVAAGFEMRHIRKTGVIETENELV